MQRDLNNLDACPLVFVVDLNSKSCLYLPSQKQLKDSVKEPNILIYFFFSPITQSCSVSNVLFTGGRGVSDFSVLKYY